jgi:hypothetical protein
MALIVGGNTITSDMVKVINTKSILTRGLSFHFDASNVDSYPGTGTIINDISNTSTNADFTTGWRLPSTYHIKGSLSNGGRTWSAGSPSDAGYSAVTLDRTFAANEDFDVVAYWAHDYRGIAIIFGANVSHLDYNGYSADGTGPYGGSLNTSGYPLSYGGTYHGQYHSPISGGGAATTGYWFRWVRSGTNISIQYSSTSKNGPWTLIKADTTCAATDKCTIVAGEASGTEASPLVLEYVRSTKRNDGGTLINGPTFSSANGGSILFDGSNDRISTGIFPNGTRTYMIWIKYNSATGTAGYQLTGTQQGGGYTYTGRQDSNGKIYTYGGSGGNGGESNYVLSTSTWYYQGFTLAANGDLGIYVNGSLIETKTGNGLGSTPTSEFSIGCINTNHFVNGNIAAVHLYDRTLTTAEVLYNYNAQKARFGY